MTIEIRTVIDTGVVVSAVLLPRSVPRQAFDTAWARGRLLISEATVAELNSVLRRSKFNKYEPEEKRLEFLAALVRQAELVEVTEVVTECRDSKDNKFLELAVSGNASHIISGDADLLALHPFRGITIVTPQAFLVSQRRISTIRPRRGGVDMQEYVVDVTNISSFGDLVEAFNEGFCKHIGGNWNGNLDAFNDYLYWPEEHPYRLVIRGWDHGTAVLGEQLSRSLTDIFRDNADYVQVVLT